MQLRQVFTQKMTKLQSYICRHSVATSLPDFARSFAKNVDLCALPQVRHCLPELSLPEMQQIS